MRVYNFDMERQKKILKKRMNEYNLLPGCRVGDWIREPNGRMTRATHDWGNTIQNGGNQYGQFYLGQGYISYSGSLDPGINKKLLKPTEETKPGKVWFFINDWAQADNGIDFMVDFRVFEVKDN